MLALAVLWTAPQSALRLERCSSAMAASHLMVQAQAAPVHQLHRLHQLQQRLQWRCIRRCWFSASRMMMMTRMTRAESALRLRCIAAQAQRTTTTMMLMTMGWRLWVRATVVQQTATAALGGAAVQVLEAGAAH